MGYRNELELRPHVGRHTHLMELIGNGRCWHFDAWLHGSPGGELFVRVETRSGGRDLLQRSAYRLHLGRQSSAGALEYVGIPTGAAITLQDRAWGACDAYKAQRELVNAAHWSAIRPLLQRRPDAFTSTSAAFHYIRAPSLAPIAEDWTNFFTYGAN